MSNTTGRQLHPTRAADAQTLNKRRRSGRWMQVELMSCATSTATPRGIGLFSVVNEVSAPWKGAPER